MLRKLLSTLGKHVKKQAVVYSAVCFQPQPVGHTPKQRGHLPRYDIPGLPEGVGTLPSLCLSQPSPAHRTSHGATPAPNQQKAEPQREGVGWEEKPPKLLVLSLWTGLLKRWARTHHAKNWFLFPVDPFPAPTHHEPAQHQAWGQDDKTPPGCNEDFKVCTRRKNTPYITLWKMFPIRRGKG